MPIISLVAALARDRTIGKDNQLLWHLPEDMHHFRETTRGKPVIMGRKTWESLPAAFRPLPGRHNIVISRNPAYLAPGATLTASLEEAIAQAGDAGEVFIIGDWMLAIAAVLTLLSALQYLRAAWPSLCEDEKAARSQMKKS